MFGHIPNEMRTFKQWIVWRYEDRDADKPTKVPYSPLNHRMASVTDPSTWVSFDAAVAALETNMYSGIGFVLTDDDPYTFIDLDDTKGDQQSLDRQIKVFNEFDSYAELSPSGAGLHIIVKGKVPSGRRRSFIEVYSSQRYMTMTGNVYRDAPIKEHDELLQVLHGQMSEGKGAAMFYAGLEQAKLRDEEVLEMAGRAANADKFNDLFYDGNWQKYYPSQSEADFALVDILAFYSENRFQVQNLFLRSALGQREKSRAQYRINYMLDRCFDRMLPPVDIDGLRNMLNEAIEAKRVEPAQPKAEPAQPSTDLSPNRSVYTPPPGLVGSVAQFIYAQAPRQVAEIALAGSIGLISGIIGRSYNISGTGLNQYILLLAPTGSGKEAIARGIDKLMGEVQRGVPAASDFIGPAEVSSAPALIKHLGRTSPSFVSIVGEFGLYFKQMCNENAPPHLVSLLRSYLELFNKSGEGNVLRPTIYSDKEKNTTALLAPAFTMLGETTAETFYNVLNEGMIASGLLPRFSMIEYNGPRPPLNESHMTARPSFELIQKLGELCAFSLQLNSQNKALHVQIDDNAKALFDSFNRHADDNINGADREVRRHLWNRAHIKALKLAAIIAVGCDPYHPTVNSEHATWAINFVIADVRNLLGKFDAGEIGIDNDETKQLQTIINTIKTYVTSPFSEVEKYIPNMGNLHSERVIPYAYLQRKLAAVAIYRKDKMGSSHAIKRALKTLVERGDITEVSRSAMSQQYKTNAVAYMIAVPRTFNL
ncbi:replicative primase helicase [Xanthomonas phage Langgrundblatt2]|uniref:Replicative primase helicase n=1 Tax=Xanthomonas phage Langgrundblatt2 TaxID=2939129 RepID=A0A9E7J559_9CAUD|nr:replicative primase helicase [Xanthomonas phage Langgrundblatt2]URA06896.1 replicative primase helicase [Xanthomonas phage Langgrundblatt2]